MRYPDDNLLLRIGMADAYAAGAEYLKFPRDNDVRDACLKFQAYVGHPTHGHAPGVYTDDTEMSVANARVLIENEPPYTAEMFANAYVAEFARGNRRNGYAREFQAFLESVKTGTEFLEKIHPDSYKNGAAMRAVPIGVLRTIPEVLDVATTQARLTHNTFAGCFSARAVALMSHYALYENEPLSSIRGYCLRNLSKDDCRAFGYMFGIGAPWSGKPVERTKFVSTAAATVHAVVHLLTRESSLMKMLERLILWGGDTDSVAAIAWGIASPRFQNEQLPDFMEYRLEKGNPYTGAKYLHDLGTQLMTKFA